MKSLHKITTFFVVFGTASFTSIVAQVQGSNPPPPVPPPPVGTPIDEWIPFFVLVGLCYGIIKVYRKKKLEY